MLVQVPVSAPALSSAKESAVVKNRARKRPKGAPVHVLRFPLTTSADTERKAHARFRAGTRLHNACLDKFLGNLAALRSDPAHAAALEMSRVTPAQKAARTSVFKDLDVAHGLTLDAAQSYASSLRRSWMRDLVPAQEAQVIGRRAFETLARYRYGQGGHPRFKSTLTASRGLHSMQSKDAIGALRPCTDPDGTVVGIRWGDPARGGLVFGFRLSKARPGSRRHREEQDRLDAIVSAVHAGPNGPGRVLSTRIVRRTIGTTVCFEAQFTVDGPAPQRYADPTPGTRGSFDLGPSNVSVAYTSIDPLTGVETWSRETLALAPDVGSIQAELRRAQRHLGRQHRVASPGCFNPDGTHLSACLWGRPDRPGGVPRSQAAVVAQAKVADLHRRLAAGRQNSHNRLSNTLAGLAQDWSCEKLNYLAWQKMYPYSVRDRAPGLFVETMRRKAGRASDASGLYEFSTYTTALSQTCLCGDRKKKTLSERTHRCGNCGTTLHRDEFSAYLGLHVHADVPTGKDTLGLEAANALWEHHRASDPLPRADTPACRDQGTKKRRGRRPSPRSVARINARRAAKRKSRSAHKSDERQPTAFSATSETQPAQTQKPRP